MNEIKRLQAEKIANSPPCWKEVSVLLLLLDFIVSLMSTA